MYVRVYICTYKCMHICIYPTPLSRAGCDTRSISKRSTTSLNSEFSFSYIGCSTKSQEPSLLYYWPVHSNEKCNQPSPGFEHRPLYPLHYGRLNILSCSAGQHLRTVIYIYIYIDETLGKVGVTVPVVVSYAICDDVLVYVKK